MISIRFPKSKKVRYILLLCAVAALLLGLVTFSLMRHTGKTSVVGKDAGVTLTDYTGQHVKFDTFVSVLNNKPVIVFFWATWCPYCTAEFARLAEVKKQYGDKLQVVAINRGESAVEAKAYTDTLPASGITFLIDSDDLLFKKFGGYAVPETLFINSKGDELFHKHGPISDEEITSGVQLLIK